MQSSILSCRKSGKGGKGEKGGRRREREGFPKTQGTVHASGC